MRVLRGKLRSFPVGSASQPSPRRSLALGQIVGPLVNGKQILQLLAQRRKIRHARQIDPVVRRLTI